MKCRPKAKAFLSQSRSWGSSFVPQHRLSARPAQSRAANRWMALLGASVIFKYQPFALSARSCAPSKKRPHSHHFPGPLTPASPGFCSGTAGGGGWAGPLGPSLPSPGVWSSAPAFAPGAVAAPWKGVFVPCGERCDQSGKNKQVRRNRYPPPHIKNTAHAFCTNPAV